MGFDGLLEEFGKQNKINTTPTIVTQTIEYGVSLVNKDYMPEIKDIKLLQQYLVHFKHMNLFTYGWRFQFGTSKEWTGLCASGGTKKGISTKGRNIYISIETVKHDANWKKNMRDTILHEIAHAILQEIFSLSEYVNYDDLDKIDDLHKASGGHGLLWKQVCGSIGGEEKHDCRIHYENSAFKKSYKNYMYSCPGCGHKDYDDSPNFTEQCRKCMTYVAVRPNVG